MVAKWYCNDGKRSPDHGPQDLNHGNDPMPKYLHLGENKVTDVKGQMDMSSC